MPNPKRLRVGDVVSVKNPLWSENPKEDGWKTIPVGTVGTVVESIKRRRGDSYDSDSCEVEFPHPFGIIRCEEHATFTKL